MLALNWPSGIVNIVDNYPATSKEWLPICSSDRGTQPKVQDGKNSWEEELPIIRHVKSMVGYLYFHHGLKDLTT
ncbi:hypothetical protein HFP67_28800 [Bacillus sp. CB102A.1]